MGLGKFLLPWLPLLCCFPVGAYAMTPQQMMNALNMAMSNPAPDAGLGSIARAHGSIGRLTTCKGMVFGVHMDAYRCHFSGDPVGTKSSVVIYTYRGQVDEVSTSVSNTTPDHRLLFASAVQSELIEGAVIAATDPRAQQRVITGQTREMMLMRALEGRNGNFNRVITDNGWKYRQRFLDGTFFFRASTTS